MTDFQDRSPVLGEEISFTQIERTGVQKYGSDMILAEHQLEILVNGRREAILSCTPSYLAELAAGYLITEGIAADLSEIEQIEMSEQETQARIRLRSGGSRDSSPAGTVTPVCWKPEWIFALADRLREGMPLHRMTKAAHSCFLAGGDELLFQCEDIGRHNAMDKAVGYALRNGINLQECILYTSGRVPAEIVRKAIAARIPVLVSKASPTALAVRIAKDAHLTLICAARSDSMRVYCDYSAR